MKKILISLMILLPVSAFSVSMSAGLHWLATPDFENVYDFNCFEVPDQNNCWIDKYAGVFIEREGKIVGYEKNITKSFHKFIDNRACEGVKTCAMLCDFDPLGHNLAKCTLEQCKDRNTNKGKICYKEFRATASATGWTARIAGKYREFEVARYKKELYELAKKEMAPVSPEFREAATELLSELGTCLKGTKDKADVKECYLNYKEALLSILHG